MIGVEGPEPLPSGVRGREEGDDVRTGGGRVVDGAEPVMGEAGTEAEVEDGSSKDVTRRVNVRSAGEVMVKDPPLGCKGRKRRARSEIRSGPFSKQRQMQPRTVNRLLERSRPWTRARAEERRHRGEDVNHPVRAIETVGQQ